MKIGTVVMLIVLTSCVQVSPQTAPRSLAITGVTIVGVTGRPSATDMAVIVRSGKVVEIGKTARVRVAKGTHVIDGRGKFLIPGLWDMHTHAVSSGGRTPRFWKLFLAHGITGTREMGNDLKSLRFGMALAKRPDSLAPRIVWSSPMLDGKPATFDSAIAVTTTTQARAVVREMRSSGFDLLKIYNGLSREAFFAIADESRRRSIPIAGEVPDSVSPAEASDAGMRSLEHMWNLFESCIPGAYAQRDKLKELTQKKAPREEKVPIQNQRDRLWLTTYDHGCTARLITKLRQNNTWLVPTLTINRNYAYIDEPPNLLNPRRESVPAKFLKYWDELRTETLDEYGTETAAAWRARYRAETDLLKQASDAGVGIMAGSDATDWEPFIYAGASLHEELQLLVAAGLSPLQALQSATLNPAIFLGKEKELGTIEVGKFADMVLLDADPLVDIRNTTKITGVFAQGRYFSKPALQKLIAEAEASAIQEAKQP